MTRIGFGVSVAGWGESFGSPEKQTSALRFGSDDAISLIREGVGSWTYRRVDDGTYFSTVYDYKVRCGLFGRLADQVAIRPLMTWAIRWSFDRLRIWIEKETLPK